MTIEYHYEMGSAQKHEDLRLLSAGVIAGGVGEDVFANARALTRSIAGQRLPSTTTEKGVWVTYNGEVYDITKFIQNHPGGRDKISLAAGKDIGPFWKMYLSISTVSSHTKCSLS